MTSKNENPLGSVMVVGGGVSGIQAALDLAALEFKVYLVEKAPMLGGKMAQLDKTFPTCDCSMCILSPKLIECHRHPNIEILTHTQVEALEGAAGNFTARLRRKPRYVDEALCVGCGLCTSYCPATAPDRFNEGLATAKAISLYCPQSVPLVPAIDPDHCLFLRETKCKICHPVCKQGAIDFSQTETRVDIRIGAVVVTPGTEIFDPSSMASYGYGRYANVVHSLAFERLLNAAGPHRGEVLRPSDGRVPRSIVWLQCVGSRDRRGGKTYCSSVCCTYAVKQLMLVKDHYPQVKVTVFLMDLRTFGKGFEEFYNRARSLPGVRFVRQRIADIFENRSNHNLRVRYGTGARGRITEEEFDLAVLSVGMQPGPDNAALAQAMNLNLDGHGFCRTPEMAPNTNPDRPGIYPAATFTAPMDIPDAISSVGGAVAQAAQLLAAVRGRLARRRCYPTEQPVHDQQPRIGVFVCHCGANIGRVVGVSAVARYAADLPHVVHAEENLFSCSADAGRRIAATIREKRLNRLVVAACTPRTHEPLFQDTLREAGINKYLFVMANIREHCSWVHSRERARATEKSKDLVAMAVARAANLVPLAEIELPVVKRGLVLGGGLAGMKAALNLARQGFEVVLVEKEPALGGNLRQLHYTLEGTAVPPVLEEMRRQVQRQPKIHTFLGYEIESLRGSVGNFTSTLAPCSIGRNTDAKPMALKTLTHGILIVATGGRAHRPTEYGYGRSARILTQQELETRIATGQLSGRLKQVAMIQCVESRDRRRPYCSRICCGQAVKNALKLKALKPDLQITVFYRDIRTYGLNEDYYGLALAQGVVFIRYEPEQKPRVTCQGRGRKLKIDYHEPILDRPGVLEADLLALSTPVTAEHNRHLAQTLKVPLTADGFFMEAHLKLRPVDFANDGVFLCGLAHYPKPMRETISQAEAAAARAATILSRDTIVSSAAVCDIDPERCTGCGLCARQCPYEAIQLKEGPTGTKAAVIATVCKGCGVCSSICPTGAVTHHHFSDRQISAQIEAAYGLPVKPDEPRILAFLCNWCGYAGADLAGVSRFQYAPNIRVVRVMCSARVQAGFIARAFLSGMDGVLVVGCHMADCHYISGIHTGARTMARAGKALARIGIDPQRLHLAHISAGEGAKYAQTVDDFDTTLRQMGALRLNGDQIRQLHRLETRKSVKSRKNGALHDRQFDQ